MTPHSRLLAAVAVLLLTAAMHSVRATLATDYLHCIERGECGLDSVCSFSLPANSGRCGPGTCLPLTGQIMRVRNGLREDVTLAWDAPGSAHTNENGTTVRPGGPLAVPAHSGRYFDTGLTGSHTVRLYDGASETLDTTVADWRTECTPNDACHYLLRACFGQTNERCTDYARHCGGFAESAEEAARRQRCVPNCYATFYLEEFSALGGEFDLYTAMNYDAVARGIAHMLGNGTNVTAYILAGSEGDAAAAGMGGGTVVVIVIAVLVVLAAALFFLYLYVTRVMGRNPHSEFEMGDL